MNDRYDVAIVGYGPVGQLLATLLGQRGYRVVVVERYGDIYPMPRAVHFDHEVARILQSVGIRADSNPIIEPYDNWYEWKNADRETLLKVDWRGVGPSWWHTSNFFAQPDLERELDARARAQSGVTVRRLLTAVGVEQNDGGVTLTVRASSRSGTNGSGSTDGMDGSDGTGPTEEISARYLVGCDGANSTIRGLLDIPVNDLGFFFDWIILDMIPNEPMTFDPPAWQLCDPARPTTIVPGGPGRRRWEFMALPGEDIHELNRAETAWRLLEPWGVTAQNAVLERHTVYRFQAHWAQAWRRGRVLIAGDAAHLMPPFAGQGMCAGLRDVFNLEWKLDLLLRGVAGEQLLHSYGPERAPHVRHFIDVSIGLGQVICVPGKLEAAERDRAMMAAIANPELAQPAPPAPRFGEGIFATDNPHAGTLSIQSEVRYGGRSGLFDDVVGRGWFVLTTAPEPSIARSAQEALDRLDAAVLRVGPAGGAADVVDLDGRYGRWFDELGADTVIVRPDFYIYAAVDSTELGAALDELDSQLPSSAGVARGSADQG